MVALKRVERMALQFIEHRGEDCTGVIDDENTLCAAVLYEILKDKGLLSSRLGDDGPVYTITDAGRHALAIQ